MVESVKRTKNDIFGWPVVGTLFKNRVALFVVRSFVMILFLSATYFGFSHPTLAENPYTTAIFWSLFWPFFMMVSLLLAGPAFCGICPHGVMGRYLSKYSLNKTIPKWLAKRGVGLAVLLVTYWSFVYLFPELLKTPFAASLLFLVLTIFALASYFLFKDMAYCTYLCPIGAVTKGYGKVGMMELRTYQEDCSTCKTFECASACTSNLQPFLFEKKNSMRDCTLCMDCADACEAVSFNLVKPAKTLTQKINDRDTAHTWVFILLLAVITVTMKFHHGLGHSSFKESLPWYKLGVWMEGILPMGIDWVGFFALAMALIVTVILVNGGYYLASKIVKVEYKTYMHSVSYALIPLVIMSSLGHIGTFFFVSYASNLANGYYWLISSAEVMRPLATFRDGWVHMFGLLGYIGMLWSLFLTYKRVGLYETKLLPKVGATLLSSLMAFLFIYIALLGR